MGIKSFIQRKIFEFNNAKIGRIDRKKLEQLFPVMRKYRSTAINIKKELKPIYEYYNDQISHSSMAISLKAGVFLAVICKLFSPESILDLGSGISSVIIRKYIPDSLLYSVDDSSKWLDKTREVLEKYDLSTNNLVDWDSFSSTNTSQFELVSFDLGDEDTRLKNFKKVLTYVRPNGLMICDDIHRTEIYKQINQLSSTYNYDIFSLYSYTIDQYKRYQFLIIPREK